MFDAYKRRRARVGPKRTRQRQIYIVPNIVFLRWYEDPDLHFDRLGLVEVDWLVYTAGAYWKDNN